MLTSAIAQHLVQVQPTRVFLYTIRNPKTEPDNVKMFNATYEHACSGARRVHDQKDQGASCFDGFVAGAMPVRHGGCRLTLRLAAAPRRHIAERGKCRGPFRAARSWFPGSPPRPPSAASRL